MGGQEGFRLDLADVPAAVAHGVPAVSVVAAAAAAALLIALFSLLFLSHYNAYQLN